MISKKYVYDTILPYVKANSRMLEYYMIRSMFENVDEYIIDELRKYQNPDGGFGNGLEPDVQMPNSSVVATDIAISSLDFVKRQELKEEMIKEIVHYYESVYDEEKNRFFMVDENVDKYPHAVWWNYKDLEKNFPYGNPDPEVIGFLYENRKYLTKLNYSKLINDVVEFVLSDKFMKAGMHDLISVVMFYSRVDDDVKNLIHDRIHLLVRKELDAGLGNWGSYCLEPYKIYVLEPHFVNTHLEALGENLTRLINQLNSLDVLPNWNWGQYDEVWDKVKYDWVGRFIFEKLRALRLHHIL